MISMQGGHFVPIPFKDMLDPATGRTRVRLVDVTSTRYAIARRYMIRLRRDDFEDAHELAKYAATCRMSLQDFRNQFEGLIKGEPPPLQMEGMPGAGLREGADDSVVERSETPPPAPVAESKPKKKG
jgi:6-phosphofructokinase 1